MSTPSPAPRALDWLADRMLETIGEDTDHLSLLHGLKTHLTDAGLRELADRLEVCPVHVRDAEICADDRSDCEAGGSPPREGTPIVPLPPESTVEVAHREREILGSFADLQLYGSEFANDDHTEVWLDWAMQIRAWGFPWPDALMIARVWYFG